MCVVLWDIMCQVDKALDLISQEEEHKKRYVINRKCSMQAVVVDRSRVRPSLEIRYRIAAIARGDAT